MKWFLNILLGCTISIFTLQLSQYFITNTVIIKIQDHINFNDTAIKLTFCILLGYLVYWLNSKTQHNIVRNIKLLKAITILTSVYSLYRIGFISHNDWNFVNIFGCLKYCDALYVIAIIYYFPCVVKLVKRLTRPWGKHKCLKNDSCEDIVISYIDDSPINTSQEDKLNFYPSVKLLLERIIEGGEYYKDRAMCIGIPAPWGSGKTSYLNLLQFAVEKDKDSNYYNEAIIVKFNPWFNSNSDRMVQDFMTTLSDTLNKYIPNISSELIHYSKILSKAQLGWFSILIDMCFNNKEDAIEKQFTEISECISQIKKPIIIFIDDMDRLQPDEIMGVLQLVRNTANFKNTIFIVPYDRDYINNALTTVKASSKYLEKIFPHPHYLPPLTQEKMKPLLYDIIAAAVKIVNEEEKEPLRMFLEYINDNFNIRSAKRFGDKLAASQSRLISLGLKDMYLFDFLIIEYIKFEYYDLYKIISNVSDLYLDNVKILTDDNIIKRIDNLTDPKYYIEHIYPQISDKIDKDLGFSLLKLIFDNDIACENYSRLKCPNIFRIYFERS